MSKLANTYSFRAADCLASSCTIEQLIALLLAILLLPAAVAFCAALKQIAS